MAQASTSYLDHTYIVILCGGGGTRLWPRSRSKTPKQFVNFFSDKTLYQEAVKRAKKIVDPRKIFVITNHDYVDDIKKESPEILKENIIAEPQKKNTALAMGVAAAYVLKKDPKAVIINFASDHTVEDLNIAIKTVLASAKVAFGSNLLVAVGIAPTFAHTGYGYIQVGKLLQKSDGLPVYKSLGFKEKPDLPTAKRFLKKKSYYWNANWYTWSGKAILDAFAKLSPGLYQNIDSIYQAIGTKREKEVLKREYGKAKEEQIDTAISEKASNLVVIPGKFGWNDVGSWNVVYDLAKKDKNQNVVIQSSRARKKQEILNYDSSNCLIHYDDQLVALVGVEDLVIVDTKNALLVCKKDRAQQVKAIVNLLKEKGKKEYL